MTRKTRKIIPKSRNFMLTALAGLVALCFFTASASALSVEQVQKDYHLSKQDAQQLIDDVRSDVKQQCKGRTDNEMARCISAKTGPVLQQYAAQCINNKKYDQNCGKQLANNNNKEFQGPGLGPDGHFNTGENQYKTINDVCGGTVDGTDQSVGISIKIGCKGKGNPIADAAFAIIRILSNGVGLVIIASIIYGGIQYTGSRGEPQATALAVNRIRSSLFALLIYIFGYAILNYLIPAGFLG